MKSSIIQDLSAIVTDEKSIVHPDDFEGYETGYRYGHGVAAAVIRPDSSDGVANVVRYCVKNSIGIIVQGANTGLVGASVPDESGDQIILSTERLTGVEHVNLDDGCVTVFAGTKLNALNEKLAAHNMFFPIDLGADPSIGGMVATNTGGARLLRYGDVRQNLLGLEVILPDQDATVLSDCRALYKNNSGLDIKQLFVGSGGSLGIVTKAILKIQPIPMQVETAIIVPGDRANVSQIISFLRQRAGPMLSACEGMSQNAMQCAFERSTNLRNPFSGDLPVYAVLVEVSLPIGEELVNLNEVFVEILSSLMASKPDAVKDIIVAPSTELWALRHSVSDSLKNKGRVLAFDLSFPSEGLRSFYDQILPELAKRFPFLLVCDFGHCGDGGVHFNLVWPTKNAPAIDHLLIKSIRDLVYEKTAKNDGSISAEHGLGPVNIDYYRKYIAPEIQTLTRELKNLIDKNNLLGSF